ncbi:MAG: glycogen/starch synthase [Ignavibacteriales bacterium]|nr:glycogen/starch synthase [Ignavibacteriales bacterium]
MPKPIGILFVASEADPFIKTSAIGDIAGNLPKILKSLGHDIRVMLPGYSSISNRRFQLHNLLRMKDIEVPIAATFEHAHVKSSYLCSDNHKVLVYFLSNDRYFDRDGLYFHPETKKYFPDNDERFIFFCRGVLETLKRLHWQPDIIHCNDWQAGLIPAYLKTIYKNDPYFKNVRTVFTVYNMSPHASFPKSSLDKSGLPFDHFRNNGNGQDSDRLNFMKMGLSFADVITTFGSRADKGIWKEPCDDVGKILHKRKSAIVSMKSENGSGHSHIAQTLIDIYRDLSKNNG